MHIIMEKIADSELILNGDGTIFHLHLKPENIAKNIILVGDPARVDVVAECFDNVTFSYDYADEERPRYMQEGDGLSQWRFQANSLKHLSDDSAVFGKIEYSNGTKRNVLWNTTSDFDLLFPYVLADSVGGDLRKEKYAFSGGCSHRTGRWLLGASGSYRALHEFRQVDPRPRNITSDFSIGGSAAYSIGEHYLDLTLLYRRYFQNQGVSFMNKRGANTSEFHLTGLGSHFGRFAGTTAYTSTYYRGQGFSAGISIFGRDRLSWSGGAKYSRFRAVRHLVNQNQAPITELYLNTLEVYADSRHFYPFAGTWEAYFSLAADFGWRQGRENVISNMSTGSFATLLSLPMYSRRALDATITGVLHKRGGALAFYPEIYWQSATAKHLFPVRNIDYGIASLSLRGGMETVRLSPLSSGGIFLMAVHVTKLLIFS